MRGAEQNDRERRLIRACEVANADPKVRAIERELDAIEDELSEPWVEARSGDGPDSSGRAEIKD